MNFLKKLFRSEKYKRQIERQMRIEWESLQYEIGELVDKENKNKIIDLIMNYTDSIENLKSI